MNISIVFPIYNEAGIVWEAVTEFATHFDSHLGKNNWQFVFVENGSTDETPQILKKVIATWPTSKVVNLDTPNYGNALREGMLHSDGEWIMIMNIDHVWDDAYFAWAWKNRDDYDMIMGSKSADLSLNSQTKYRKMLSSGLNVLLRYFFDFMGTDSHGMKIMRATSVLPVAKECVMRRGQFDTELTIRVLRSRLWVCEVPVPYKEKRVPRNFMIKKIVQNIVDLFRFYHIMKSVPALSPLRYRRFCREDLLNWENSNK